MTLLGKCDVFAMGHKVNWNQGNCPAGMQVQNGCRAYAVGLLGFHLMPSALSDGGFSAGWRSEAALTAPSGCGKSRKNNGP